MKCPKCKKGELQEHISIKGVFKSKKVYTYFCPLCNYKNKKEFPYSWHDKMKANAEIIHKGKGTKIDLNIKKGKLK